MSNIFETLRQYTTSFVDNKIFTWHDYPVCSNLNNYNPHGIDWGERLERIMGLLRIKAYQNHLNGKRTGIEYLIEDLTPQTQEMVLSVANRAIRLNNIYCKYGENMCCDEIYDSLVMDDLIYSSELHDGFIKDFVGFADVKPYKDLLYSDIWAVAPKYEKEIHPLSEGLSPMTFIPSKIGGLGYFEEMIDETGFIPYMICYPSRLYTQRTKIPVSEVSIVSFENDDDFCSGRILRF